MRTSVRAHEIASLLDDAPEGVRCLSLDCFDTLIWRNAHAPTDLFAELPLPGGGVEARRGAEQRARRLRRQCDRLDEVSIEAIHAQLLPHVTEEERAAAVAHEIAVEARHCYAFAPVVALIRAAKARGLQVVVVSDTYLSAAQLRALIATAAGHDVAALIDGVFASSEYGVSKGQGLFRPVMEALRLDPFAILHLGDNRRADHDAPRKLGIRAVHFEQFDPSVARRLRLEAVAAAMVDPAVGVTLPVRQPHRPQLALRVAADDATALGHDVLGPIMHAFALWTRDEAAALAEATGRRVRTLFLLRDGHLPHRAFAAADLGDAAAIEVSRLTATAAGFRDEASIRAWLADEPSNAVPVLARQLLLTDAEARQVGRTATAFRARVLAPGWVRKIVARSRAFAERLAEHVRRAGGVEPGDAVMLVDLGYNGSVQNMIATTLAERLDVHVAGRYLLLRELYPTGHDKKGLIDARHYETRLLNAYCRSVAVLEQVCTAALGSVVDYYPNGRSIRSAVGVKGAQSDAREAVQQGCLAFVREAGKGVHRAPVSDDVDCRRQLAAAVLTRFLFLPMEEEVALLGRFEHDVNLGRSDLVKLIDPDAAASGLRRRGMPYLSSVERMYLPGEIQPHGLPLALSLFSTGRFAFDLRGSDFQVGGIDVPLLVADGAGQAAITARAYPTHEGFYLLTAPAGAGRLAIGIRVGAIAECVQIEEIAFYPVDGFADFSAAPVAQAMPVFDAMEEIAPGVHRCEEGGLILVPPPTGVCGEQLLLAVAFRPVVRRTAAASAALREAA